MLPNPRAGKWLKAKVEDQVRSYDVRTEDGRVFHRNRRHLRKSPQPPAPVPPPAEEPVIPRDSLLQATEVVPVELPAEPALIQDKFTEVSLSHALVLPTGVRASGHQIKIPARFKDFDMS
ncbi:uncharacterized protein LOC144657623 [Oculina patagonica]